MFGVQSAERTARGQKGGAEGEIVSSVSVCRLARSALRPPPSHIAERPALTDRAARRTIRPPPEPSPPPDVPTPFAPIGPRAEAVASVTHRDGGADGRSSWAPLMPIRVAAGLCLRVAAAGVVQWYGAAWSASPASSATRAIYWQLAQGDRAGRSVRVDQWGVPTSPCGPPAIPSSSPPARQSSASVWCPVRLVQATLGTLGVYFVYRLVMCVTYPIGRGRCGRRRGGWRRSSRMGSGWGP